MKSFLTKIILLSFLLPFIIINSLQAATEHRIALVIGNSAYSSGPLKNPVNDAADMAAVLKKLGFTVTLKRNARLQEMDEAIEELGNRLKRGGVGLFYYSGHGVQINGANYLLPIGAKINKEADVKYQAVDANKILDEMATANNGLNIVILDACRDNPFARSFRNASRGLAIVSSAPSGTFISYSTSPGNVARDGDGRNSPYTAALLKYMQEPGLTISDVFINVRTNLKKETGQVPWELSSLEGQFSFLPGSARKTADTVPAGKATLERDESYVSTTAATDDLDDEQRKVELEKQRLEKEEALLTEKTALEEKRRRLEEKKKLLAMVKPPAALTSSEMGRDDYHVLWGVWRCSDSTAKYRIFLHEGRIVVEGWDSRDNERFIISDISSNGNNLRFTSRMPSTNWTVHHNCIISNNHEMEVSTSGATSRTYKLIKE
jgi:uncharacterized caspase-like protein